MPAEWPVADDAWEEETMNWNSKPPVSGSALGSFGAVTVGQWSELDLIGVVTGGDKVRFYVIRTENTTSRFAGILERMMGLEPTTFCMASRRSSQLSYIRTRRPV
jgi:hypothetical protein